MGCTSTGLINEGKDVTVQETNIALVEVENDCRVAVCNITCPWGTVLTGEAFDQENEFAEYKRTYYNPNNSNDFITVELTDTYCMTGVSGAYKTTATFTVCYDAPAATGTIECATSPSGADIYYDGTKQNYPTPLNLIKVPAGSHTIQYKLDGYKDSDIETVNVVAGESVIVVTTLVEIQTTGYILCKSDPTEADIYYDGNKQSFQTNTRIINVPIGTHTIQFKKEGFKNSDTDTFHISAGKTITVEKTLIKYSTIKATSNVESTVTVIVDGETITSTSKTTHMIPNIPSGQTYETTFTADGYTSCTLNVAVVADVIAEAHCDLVEITTTGKILCKSEPTDADIYYDGSKQSFQTNVTIASIPPGSHTIQFKKEGWKDSDVETVEVVIGETATVEKTLIRGIQSTVLVLDPITTPVNEGDSVTISGVLKAGTVGVEKQTVLIKDGQGVIELIASVETDSDGKFTTNWAAERINTWPAASTVKIYAKFNGTADYETSMSDEQTITIDETEIVKKDTVLTLNVDPTTVTEGMDVVISGTLKDTDGIGIDGALIKFKDKDILFDSNVGITATTESNGNYSVTWKTEDLDWFTTNVELYAVFDGNVLYNKSESSIVVIEVGGIVTHLTLESVSSGVVEGDVITFTGQLTADDDNDMAGRTIGFFDFDVGFTKELTDDDGNPLTAITTANGQYSVDWTVKAIDFWNVFVGDLLVTLRAEYAAVDEYGSCASHVKEINISSTKQVSLLTLKQVDSETKIGSELPLIGMLTADDNTPIANATVAFTDKVASENTDRISYVSTTTDTEGKYSTSWTVMDDPGGLRVWAQFKGNDEFREAQSDHIFTKIVAELPEIENSITVNVIDTVETKEYDVKVFWVAQTPIFGRYVNLGQCSYKTWKSHDRDIVFTERNGLEKDLYYYISAEKYPSLSVAFDYLTQFKDHETIERTVKGSSELVRKICEMLQLDDCDTFAEMLTLDILTPLIDGYAIIHGVDPYTNEPIENMDWYYLFFILGAIPVVGWVPKVLSNGGKLSTKGVKLANLARKSPAIQTELLKPGILAKIINFTSAQIDLLIEAAGKGADDLLTFLKSDSAKVEFLGKNTDDALANAETLGQPAENVDKVKALLKTVEVMSPIFNFDKQGIDLFTLALTDANLARALEYGRLIGKVDAITEDIADILVKLAQNKQYEEITQILNDVPDTINWSLLTKDEYAAIYTKLDNIVFDSLYKIDPDGNSPKLLYTLKNSAYLQYGELNYISDYLINGYLHAEGPILQKLNRVSSETIEVISRDSVFGNTIAIQAGADDFAALISKLNKSSDSAANALSDLLHINRQFYLNYAEQLFPGSLREIIKRTGYIAYKSAITKNTSYIKTLRKLIFDDAGHIKSLDEISDIELFKGAVKFEPVITSFIEKYTKLLSDVSNGIVTDIATSDIDDFLNHIMGYPETLTDLKRAMLDNDVDISTLLLKLDDINTPASNALSGVFKHSTSAKNLDNADKIISGSAGIMKSTVEKSPDAIQSVTKSLDDAISIADSAKKTTVPEIENITGDALTSIIDDLKTNPSAHGTSIRARLDTAIGKIGNFIKTHPERFAGVGVVVIISVMALLVKMVNDYDKAHPRPEPDTPIAISVRLNSLLDAIDAAAWNVDAACKNSNADRAKEIYDQTLITIDYFNSYLESIKDDISESAYNEYISLRNTALDTLESKYTCKPTEIEIPTDGIIKDVTVKKIIDGDTIECWKDDETFEVRMVGYNTPEKKPSIITYYPVTCTESVGSTPHTIECSKETYQEANGFFWHLVESKTVTLKIDPDRPKDSYFRYLAVVILEDGSDANLKMIKAGHACFYHEDYFGTPTIYDSDKYIAARDNAKAAGIGIWAVAEEEDIVTGEVVLSAMYETATGTKSTLTNTSVFVTNDAKTRYFPASNTARELPVGEYIAKFEHIGYESISKEFTIAIDTPQVIRVVMVPIEDEDDEDIVTGEVVLSAMYETATGTKSTLTNTSVFVTNDTEMKYFPASNTARELPVGEYIAKFEHIDYKDKIETFTIEHDIPKLIRIVMEPIDEDEEDDNNNTGYAIFTAYKTTQSTGTTTSVTANIWAGLNPLYETDASELRKWLPGEHTVTFQRSGFKSVLKTFTIETGLSTIVDVEMFFLDSEEDDPDDPDDPEDEDVPSTKIDFMSTPSGAEVYLDSAYIGMSKKVAHVSPGEHTVDFIKYGYETCTQTFVAVVDVPQPISCILTELDLEDEEYTPTWTTLPSTTPSRRYTPSAGYVPPSGTGEEYDPTHPTETGEDWALLSGEISVAVVSVGKKIAKYDSIIEKTTKFIEKHCDLDIKFTDIEHDMVEPEESGECAVLDDPEYLIDNLDLKKFKDDYSIICLLWDAENVKCVEESGFTGSIDEKLWEGILVSVPTSKAEPNFIGKTGKIADMALHIKYNGSITILIQLIEALHELYHATKNDDAPELPELDKEFCGKDFINDERPNSKCIVKWFEKLNEAVPTDSKSAGRPPISQEIKDDIYSRRLTDTIGGIAARYNLSRSTVKRYMRKS